MRLTAFLLTMFSVSVCANGVSQTVSFSGKNVSLETIFSAVEKQTGFVVFYDYRQITGAKPISVDVKNEPLSSFLNACFKNQPFDFVIEDKTILITKSSTPPDRSPERDNLSLLAVFPVTGVVHDAEGVPVANVTVSVKGSKTSTSTDDNGKFSLNVNVGDVLIFTSIGFEKTEITIKNTSPLTITLNKATSELDEVVINKGYYYESRRFSTGNVTTVKAEDIEKQPVSNPLFALQGRVPGLLITQNTGMANGAFTVRIQGQNSIASDNVPLILVDGVPLSYNMPTPNRMAGPLAAGSEYGNNPISFINPADIESIDILKDADATAIYGSRAANGAILITTKKGKSGKAKMTIGFQQGWSRVGRKVDLLNTRQYLDMRYEAIRNDGLTIGTTAAFHDLKQWDTTRYTDWQEELIGRTASYTNATASLSGGTNNVQYLIGATFNRNTTVFPGNFANQSRGIHFNINTTSANQKFKLSITGSYTINDNGVPGRDLTPAALSLVPIAPALYSANGTLNWAPTPAGSSTWNNPMATSAYEVYEHTTKILTSNAQISYAILQGLTIKSTMGYNHTQIASFNTSGLESIRPEIRNSIPRSSDFGSQSSTTWIIEPQLTFNKQLGKAFLDMLTGATIQKNDGESVHISASGFPSDLLLKNLSSATSTNSFYINYVYKYNAFFGRLNFNWDKRYIMNVAVRRDGSSRFGEKNRFNNFWSIGTAWLFSEENRIKNIIPILSFGKLRISYGITGNDGIPDYQFINTYVSTTAGIPYQGLTGLSTIAIGNPYLQWEETRKLQGGIELGFFNDRVLINATYVRNRSSNQLIGYPLPRITGVPIITQNFPALVQNTNWEFSASIAAIKNKNLSWTSNINLTTPRNKLLSFPNIEKSSYADGTLGVIVGQPLGVLNYYHYLGIDPSTGNYVFSDGSGNPVFNPSDRTILLSPLPAYYGGLTNSITYKSFTLDFLFQYIKQKGIKSLYYFVSSSERPGRFSRGNGNQPVSVMNHWQKPGDMTTTSRFSTLNDQGLFFLTQSDGYYSDDASFVRLKNVSLSWQLPPNLLKKVHLQNGNIYFRGQNLATITHYTGLDPETQSNVLPPLQTWTLGFTVIL